MWNPLVDVMKDDCDGNAPIAFTIIQILYQPVPS